MERFYYILKSGLLIEQLQIDSFVRLVNALQLYALIAWHVIWLQRLARVQSNKPATDYIEQQTIKVVERVMNRKIITVTKFLVATAMLGGFIPTNKQALTSEKTL